MQTQTDIHFEFSVPNSTDLVYTAISQVKEWWIRDTEGETAAIGDSFSVRFGSDSGFVKFLVTEAVPGRRYVWHVEDCFLPWFDDKTEWNGTDVVFDIAPATVGSSVALVHRGLTPAVACYDACTAGWQKFFTVSLYKLLTDGVGTPQ